MAVPCPHCGCAAVDGGDAHAVLAMLAVDDLDAALELGLLDAEACAGCDADCNTRLIAARDARRVALAARARYRARGTRLARRKAEREAARAPVQSSTSMAPTLLPPSAADVLARALAKAAARKP
jgi:hypothetical protein